jgi:hypothetical protein
MFVDGIFFFGLKEGVQLLQEVQYKTIMSEKGVVGFFGKNLLKRTKCVFHFFFVMVDCIFVSECRCRLIVNEFGIRLATW